MPGETDNVSLHFETLRVFQTVVVTDGCFDTAEESVERKKLKSRRSVETNGVINTRKSNN